MLDATNGQNAIRQAEVFTKAIGCTGIILTKLDGTAKGGVVVAVRQTIDLPVKFIGVGEELDDLQPFDADAFVESLFTDAERHGGSSGRPSTTSMMTLISPVERSYVQPWSRGSPPRTFQLLRIMVRWARCLTWSRTFSSTTSRR